MSKDLASQPQQPHWMVVYLTHDPTEAHIVAGRLESEGIPAMVNRAVGAGALGITIGSLGEVRVLVRPADYELALDILNPDEAERLPDEVDRIIFGDDADESDDETAE